MNRIMLDLFILTLALGQVSCARKTMVKKQSSNREREREKDNGNYDSHEISRQIKIIHSDRKGV